MEATITIETVPESPEFTAGAYRYTVTVINEGSETWQAIGFASTEAEAKSEAEAKGRAYYEETRAAEIAAPQSYTIDLGE